MSICPFLPLIKASIFLLRFIFILLARQVQNECQQYVTLLSKTAFLKPYVLWLIFRGILVGS